jgi:preprotein translocase subunit SecB
MTQQVGQEATLPFVIRGQYIKDLSFENPNPLKYLVEESDKEPSITVDIQATSNAIAEKIFEVVLHVRVDAKRNDEQMFLGELTYAGLVSIGELPDEFVKPLLLIHCPNLLFPFARNILSDAVRDGGFPPLMLAPVDFAYLYQQQHGEAQEAPQQATA